MPGDVQLQIEPAPPRKSPPPAARSWVCAIASLACVALGLLTLRAYGTLHWRAVKALLDQPNEPALAEVQSAMIALDLGYRVAGVLAVAWAITSLLRKEATGARLLALGCGLVGVALILMLM